MIIVSKATMGSEDSKVNDMGSEDSKVNHLGANGMGSFFYDFTAFSFSCARSAVEV